MSRPNFDRMQRQQRDMAAWVGETATWHRYVSASAGNPAYGFGDAPQYVASIITGLFAPVLPEELNAPGGVYLAGDVRLTPIDVRLGSDDRVTWRGALHQVMSDPLPQALVGGAQRVLLRRGGQTG